MFERVRHTGDAGATNRYARMRHTRDAGAMNKYSRMRHTRDAGAMNKYSRMRHARDAGAAKKCVRMRLRPASQRGAAGFLGIVWPRKGLLRADPGRVRRRRWESLDFETTAGGVSY
jgi:hypothetical protein